MQKRYRINHYEYEKIKYALSVFTISYDTLNSDLLRGRFVTLVKAGGNANELIKQKRILEKHMKGLKNVAL